MTFCVFSVSVFLFRFSAFDPPLALTLIVDFPFCCSDCFSGFMISAWPWTLFLWTLILYFCLSDCFPGSLDLCLCFWIAPPACHLIDLIFHSYPESALSSLSPFLTKTRNESPTCPMRRSLRREPQKERVTLKTVWTPPAVRTSAPPGLHGGS